MCDIYDFDLVTIAVDGGILRQLDDTLSRLPGRFLSLARIRGGSQSVVGRHRCRR